MNKYDFIVEKLESIESLFGITGGGIVIFMIILSIAGYLYLKSYAEGYVKSFFNQSLAVVQSNLTEKIDEQFINQQKEIEKEISKVKSTLGLAMGSQNDFLNEKRKSLLDLYLSYVDWTSTVMSKSASGIDENNLNIRKEYIKEINSSSHKFYIASASYQIYGGDKELNEICNTLLKEGAELQELREQQLFKIEMLNKDRVELGERSKYSILNQTGEQESLRSELSANAAKITSIQNAFDEQLHALYHEIIVYQAKASSRISKLIKETFEGK